jgi:hypothetical protein
MNQRTAETLADARWFPLRYDQKRDEIHFVWIPAETHRALTFVSDLRPTEVRSIPRQVISDAAVGTAPLHVILHSGLGGSTLLARALAQPGVVTTLKEPPILTDMVAFGLRNSEADSRELLQRVRALLSRPFELGETLVCKMSSIGNGLSSAIAELGADTQILCLQTPLELMLASLAAKGTEGRAGGRRLLIGLQNARMAIVQLSESELRGYGDLQLAGLAWLSIQRMIHQAGKRFGPERVRSIGSEQLLEHPAESLSEISRHFRLSLDLDARLASGVLARHAKTGQPFDSRKRAEALAETLRVHGGEIGPIVDWARKVAEANGVAWDLPYPLFD